MIMIEKLNDRFWEWICYCCLSDTFIIILSVKKTRILCLVGGVTICEIYSHPSPVFLLFSEMSRFFMKCRHKFYRVLYTRISANVEFHWTFPQMCRESEDTRRVSNTMKHDLDRKYENKIGLSSLLHLIVKLRLWNKQKSVNFDRFWHSGGSCQNIGSPLCYGR